MTNECARATILADRCARYRDATLAEQARDTKRRWNRRQRDRTNRLVKQLKTDPAAAMAGLLSFARGCLWVIDEFQSLIDNIKRRGYLLQEEIEQVIRLYDISPVPEMMSQHIMAYQLYTHHLGCALGVSAETLAAWLAPANRPLEIQDLTDDELVAADAAQALLAILESEVVRLKAEERRIWIEEDGPSLERLLDGASILTEEAARRVGRSHSESRTTFHRGWTALSVTLKRDKEEGPAQTYGNPTPSGVDEGETEAVDAREAIPPGAGEAAPDEDAVRVQIEPSSAPDETAQVAKSTGISGEARPPAEGRREAFATGPRGDVNRANREGSASAAAKPEAAADLAGECVVDGGHNGVQIGPRSAPDETAEVADSTTSSGEVEAPAQERREVTDAGSHGACGAVRSAGRDIDPPGSDITFERPATVSAQRHEELTALYRKTIERALAGMGG